MDQEIRVFVSYSWESQWHREKIKQFVQMLKAAGICVVWDQENLSLGERLARFMLKSINTCDYVLFACTPEYKRKADGNDGGVGFENVIITEDVYIQKNEKKFIPVKFSGTWAESLPQWAIGKNGVDLSNAPDIALNMQKLIRTITKKDFPPNAPGYQEELITFIHHLDTAERWTGNTSGNIINAAPVAERGRYWYYAKTIITREYCDASSYFGDGGPDFIFKYKYQLCRKDVMDDKETFIAECDSLSWLNIVKDWAYFVNFTGTHCSIDKISLADGKRFTVIRADVKYLNAVGSKLYYIDDGMGHSICSVNDDGTELTCLFSGKAISMFVNNGWAYFVEESTQTLFRLKTEQPEICEQLTKCRLSCPVVSGEWLFFINLDEDKSIYKLNLETRKPPVRVSNELFGCISINASDTLIYVLLKWKVITLTYDGGEKKIIGHATDCMGYRSQLFLLGTHYFCYTYDDMIYYPRPYIMWRDSEYAFACEETDPVFLDK